MVEMVEMNCVSLCIYYVKVCIQYLFFFLSDGSSHLLCVCVCVCVCVLCVCVCVCVCVLCVCVCVLCVCVKC